MLDAFQVIRYSLQDLWDDLVMLVILNVLWSLAALLPVLPLAVGSAGDLAPVLIGTVLLALPLPIVSGGLCYVTNQIARGKAVGWGVFLHGLRRYWAKSLGVAAINLLALILWVSNVRFYSLILPAEWRGLALIFWLVLGLYWLTVQLFWFPMILELEKEQVFLALRSALAMALITPAFSLTLIVVLALLVVVSLALMAPVALFTISLLLLIGNHATRSRLAYVQKKPYRPRSHTA